MKKAIWYFVFTPIILGSIFGNLLGIKWMDYLFKPFIMVWIALFFVYQGRNIDLQLKNMILFAFAFSWAGDVLLMFSGRDFIWFILGLVSFLLAQVFYVLSFIRSVIINQSKGFILSHPVWLIPFIAYGIIIFSVLYDHLDPVLRLAVLVYMIAIITMSCMAFNRKNAVGDRSFRLVFIGSLLFIVSDTLLAVNKFVVPVPLERLFVLGSYISAQYLIMRGVISQFIPEKAEEK